MKLIIEELTEERAMQVCAWEYEGEYSIYNFTWEKAVEQGWSITIPEARKSDFRAVIGGHGELAGFFRMTEDDEGKIEIGLGLRPDLCGHGTGKDFVKLITQYTLNLYPACQIYMEVRTFNRRAIKCYEACGYRIVKQHRKAFPSGSVEYFLMEYQNT